jgi:predicted secreted hydrolase
MTHRLLTFLIVLVVVATGCSRPAQALPEAPTPEPTQVQPVVFPRDAGPHDALTEWWYYTGHLRSNSDGRTFGFEFVVFQVQRQDAPTGYLAHFAVTDVDGQRFSHQSRFAQAQQAAAGFPLDVSGWRLGTDGPADVIQAAMSDGPGADPPFSVSLRLTDDKPPALHHGGFIDYGPAGGSYYYSRTRLSVVGSIGVTDGERLSVSGIAWMDHQWGNFVVAPAGGWDWYSLQLDDGSELMLYVLRSATGETTGAYGSEIARDGSVRDVQPGSVLAEATGRWSSAHTGAQYPSGWLLTLADGERLVLRPQLQDQELWFPEVAATGAGAMAYWEGAVTISGDRGGVGYVELTGYAPARASGTGP